MSNSSLCPLPWMHLSVDFDESLRICCNAGEGREVLNDRGEKVYLPSMDKFPQVLNYSFYKKARKEMMGGKLPSYCFYCQKLDQAGGISPRQHFLHQYEDKLAAWLENTDDDGHFNHPPDGPVFLDFSLGNNCNLRCRMCSPVFSSSLTSVFEHMGFDDQYSKESVERAKFGWNFDDKFKEEAKKWFRTMDKILLQGGEPFVTKGAKELLSLAIDCREAHHINLKITSNLTKLDNEWLNILSQFKGVAIHVSLEGTQEVNDYIRQGSEWDKIHQNIEKLLKLKKMVPISFDFHSVFQVYNVKNIVPYLKEIEERYHSIPFFGFLRYPEYLSPAILPKEWKAEIRKDIESYLDSLDIKDEDVIKKTNAQTLRGLLNMMDFTPDNREALWDKMIQYTKGLDDYYQTSINDIFPELGSACYEE